MIFIKTTDNLRFGGFTSSIWPKSRTRNDNEAFLFSLSKKKKYKVINQELAIGVDIDWISFGYGNDLFIYNKLKTNGGGTCKCYYDIPSRYDLNEGKGGFKVLKCEIYQIEF